jgi:hypothetical protein
VEDLKQLRGQHHCIGQPVAQHKGQSTLKRVVRQDAGVQEAAEEGLCCCIPLCFPPAEARNRIMYASYITTHLLLSFQRLLIIPAGRSKLAHACKGRLEEQKPTLKGNSRQA